MNNQMRALKLRSDRLIKLRDFVDHFDTIVERKCALANTTDVRTTAIKIQNQSSGLCSSYGMVFIQFTWMIGDIVQDKALNIEFAWLAKWYDLDDKYIAVHELLVLVNNTLDIIVHELEDTPQELHTL